MARARHSRRALARARWPVAEPALGVAGCRCPGPGGCRHSLARAARALPGEPRLRRASHRARASGAPQRSRQHGAREGAPGVESGQGRAVARAAHGEATRRRARGGGHRSYGATPTGLRARGARGPGWPLRTGRTEEPARECRAIARAVGRLGRTVAGAHRAAAVGLADARRAGAPRRSTRPPADRRRGRQRHARARAAARGGRRHPRAATR